MTAVIGKYAAKKMLNSQLKKYSNKEPAGQFDPFYEYRNDPRTGRKKKYKKQIPDYIPEHDAQILATVRKRAYRLDMALFTFMGIRFGWSSVIGLVPEVGDVFDMLLAYSLYSQCKKVEGGLDSSTKNKMKMWILLDFVIGLVPVAGDLLDASFKANTRNVRLLELALDKKYKPSEVRRHEDLLITDGRRQHEDYHEPAPATVYEEISDEEPPQYTSRQRTPEPLRPDPARVQQQQVRQSGAGTDRKNSRSWLGSRREKPNDVENPLPPPARNDTQRSSKR